MNERKRVLMDIPVDRAYVRSIFMGVGAFARANPHFLLCQPELAITNWRAAFELYHPEGLIWNIPSIEDCIERRKLCPHIVDVSGGVGHNLVPKVMPDNLAIGRMAATHLLDSGLRHIAYVGYANSWYSGIRLSGLTEICERYHVPLHVMPDADRFVSYTQYDVRIEQFLRDLPHPVGLFAANDNLALRVMRAARNIDLHIPDQLALLGCDDDELALALSSPELSSIELPAHKLGFTAAEILDRMMRGLRVSNEAILLAPVGVVRRGSTDILAVNDPDVLSAMRFIQDHAHESIQVPAVLSHVMLSRRSLELKFRKHLGKSPADAIRDARLLRAKHLLHATDKSIPAVAKLAGFGNTKHFARMFKEHAGVSPTAFRKTFQRR